MTGLTTHLKNFNEEQSLENRVRISIEMADHDNWVNGEYFGDPEVVDRITQFVLMDVRAWKSTNAPMFEKERAL